MVAPPKLIPGSDQVAQSETILGSILPVTLDAGTLFVPALHRFVIANPNLGNLDFTLPDGTSSAGVCFELKRNEFVGNFVRLLTTGADTIDGTDQFILGNKNEVVVVISDGTPIWRVRYFSTFAIAAIQFIGTTETQSITTLFQKIDVWTTDAFITPGRVASDFANNKFSVLNIQNQAPGQDGYKVFFEGAIEYQNNVDLDFVMFVDGVQSEAGITVTGKGTNIVVVSFNGIIGVQASGGVPQDIDIRVKGISANTITYHSKMNCLIERIGG